jgi:hypothetical protein
VRLWQQTKPFLFYLIKYEKYSGLPLGAEITVEGRLKNGQQNSAILFY